jgi:hypothetical protein
MTKLGGFMKGLSGTLVALAFAIFSLISLISVNRTWDNSLVQLADTEARVSELGLRFNMQR